jgi:hypothetical protein
MTTLRRALPGLYKGRSILALAALVCVAMMLAGQPALASGHGGGGGGGGHGGGGGGHASGGGHAGGGGGHASGGSGGGHMSAAPPGAHGYSGSFGGGRAAHPVGPGTHFGPNRLPGSHGFFNGDHGRFHGDFDRFDGRFFGGFGFGWGLGLGLGFAWDYPWGWGWPGWYGYDPWWYGGYPAYYGSYYDRGYGNPSSSRYSHDEMGAIDLDISPSDAEVYLNGEFIGHVRDFGGWRRGNLWLEKGTYDIVFYREGYKTLARQVTIYPGLVITWDDKMQPGQAVRPEELPSKSHERRDSRLQFERDRADRIDRERQMQRGGPYYDQRGNEGQEDGGGWSDNWHDRVNRDRHGAPGSPGSDYAQPQRNARPAPAPGPAVAAVTSDQYGRLHLKVEPEDASVYLDGRFVGTGSDLSANEAGLVLAPGRHKLAVVRPGRRAEERDFDAVLGKDVDLAVTLSTAGQ